MSFSDCRREADNNPTLVANQRRLPSNDTNKQLRGAIVSFDWILQAFRKCAAHPQAQAAIRNFEAQRASALKTCRQISSVDNCLVSPF